MQPSEIVDAGVEEDTGVFFKRIGEICFTPASDAGAYSGHARSLAVAPAHGVVFFSDVQGMLVLLGNQRTS